MKNEIQENIHNPEQLELLYRTDKKGFETAFFEIYPEISKHKTAEFWRLRLTPDSNLPDSAGMVRKDVLILIISCAVTGFLIKLPQIFGLDLQQYLYYEKNAGLIVLLGLTLYAFLIRGKASLRHILITFAVFALSALYINLLPSDRSSHSVTLAFLHLPLMLWCLYGLVFIDFDTNSLSRRIDFIRYNGELAIWVALMAIAGGILSGVTIGLFEAIGLKIEQFYFNYIIIIGMVSAPVAASFIIRFFPAVTGKIAPIIANIFSPVVLVTLLVYLASILLTGKDPYNDRDFLIIFNLMLLGVMAIIVFSVSEAPGNSRQCFNEAVLLALAIITLITDLVALSAILYRLGEFGFTPNRIAVMGSNLLIFGNLVLIMIDLFKVNFKRKEVKQVEVTIARYLPVYALWTVFVVFVLPWIFGLK